MCKFLPLLRHTHQQHAANAGRRRDADAIAGAPNRGRRTVGVNWAEVYEATYRELVRFLYRKVRDVERAQDLTQEVFVRALRHEPESPRALLFHVANHLAREEAPKAITRREHLQLLRSEANADVVMEVAEEM